MGILLQPYWMFRYVETSRPYRQAACLFLLFRIPHPLHILLTRYLAGAWLLKLYVGEEMVVTYFEVICHISFEKCGVQIDAGNRSRCCVFSHIKGAGTPYRRVASHNVTESMSSIHVTSNGFREPLWQASFSGTAGSSLP